MFVAGSKDGSTRQKCFYDIPGELRNQIYEHYCLNADRSSIWAARNRCIPPSLALVSRWIRKEFLVLWDLEDHLTPETRHVNVAVFDLDFGFMIEIWKKAITSMKQKGKSLEAISVTLVFTRSCRGAEAEDALHNFFVWCKANGQSVCPDRGLQWKILDYRRFGRLKQAYFLFSVFVGPIRRNWRSIDPCEAWSSIVFAIRGWSSGHVRGLIGS